MDTRRIRLPRCAGRGMVLLLALVPLGVAAIETTTVAEGFLGDPPVAPELPAPTARLQALAAPAAVTPAGGFTVDTDNRQLSRGFFNSVFLGTANIDSGWNGDVGGCDAGATTTAFKDNVLARVNFFRAMAGVPADLLVDAATSVKAQEAALMMSANDSLSHSPPTSWDCYTAAGAEGASRSNLAWGSYGSDAIFGYMQDNGSNNTAVGHRRYILYPQTESMGTGDIPPESGYTETNALWVFDGNYFGPRPAVRDDFVAWPPPGFIAHPVVPVRWSFSYPGADFSLAQVSMSSDGELLAIEREPVANGYGENTLVWVPDGLNPDIYNASWPEPVADTTYQVDITGVRIGGVATDFSYQVTVIDPQAAGPDEELPAVSGSSVIPVGQAVRYDFDPVSFADTHEVLSAVASPYTTLLGAETASADIVDGSNANYPLRDSQVAATGSYSYHLAHTTPTLQFFELEGAFHAEAAARLRFSSRLGWASVNQVARAELSLDDGTSWNAVYTQAGTNNSGENSFTAREIDLSAYAGKSLRLRFSYAFEGGSYYSTASSGTGFYVDDIRLESLSKLGDTQIQTVSGSDSFLFSADGAGDYLLQVRAVPWAGFPGLEWGEAFPLTVSAVLNWVEQDVSGDGRADILIRNRDTDFVYLWEMDGPARTYRGIGLLPSAIEIVGVADLTGDGTADIVRRNTANGWVSMWEMDSGSPVFRNIGALGLDIDIVGIDDLTGDGRADIVRRNRNNGWVSLWEMNGPLPSYHNIGALPLHVEIVAVADLTGDGRADIVRRNTGNGWVSMWQMDGPVATYRDIGALSLDVDIVGAADLTGDGRADIVRRHAGSGWVSLWEMQGNLPTYHNIGALAPEIEIVGIRDLNGDGMADIIRRHTGNGAVSLWQMDGNLPTYFWIGALPLNREIQAPPR